MGTIPKSDTKKKQNTLPQEVKTESLRNESDKIVNIPKEKKVSYDDVKKKFLEGKSVNYERIDVFCILDAIQFVFHNPCMSRRRGTGVKLWLLAMSIHNLVRMKDGSGNVMILGGTRSVPRILTDIEMNVLLEQLEDEFIQSVKTKKEITLKEEIQIRDKILRYRPEDVYELLRERKPNLYHPKMKIEHIFEKIIHEDKQRIFKLVTTQNILSIPIKTCIDKAAKFYNQITPKVHDVSEYSNIESASFLVSRCASKVTSIQDHIDSFTLVENCKLLRKELEETDPNKPNWDQYCCLRQCGNPDYMNSRNCFKESLCGIKETSRLPLPTD